MDIPSQSSAYYPLYPASYLLHHSYPTPPALTPIKQEPLSDSLSKYSDKDDKSSCLKPFAVSVRPEIRKGCVWEVQFRMTDDFLSCHAINKLVAKVTTFDHDLESLKEGEYTVVLKIRSKLIEPIKEVPFEKVAKCVGSSLRIEVVNGVAVLRVKFTARPRNIFHKHADVMILVATLFCGNDIIAEDQQELVFRGGTGSAHSAENRKLSVLKKNSAANALHNTYPMGQLPYATQMMYPYSMPTMNTSLPLCNQQPQQPPAISQNIRAENLTVPELDEFDTDTFFSDFMNNKGDSLMPFEQQQEQTNNLSTDYQTGYLAQNQNHNAGFSFNVTGFQIQPNGVFQGTIEGMYLNKQFRGSFQTSITDTNLQGSFNGTFIN